MSCVDDWLVAYNPRPQPRSRLFCFGHAGSSGAMYRSWQEIAPPWLEICPLELPGHFSRMDEPLPTAFKPLMQDAAQALTPLLDRPYGILGNSMGSLLAYELALAFPKPPQVLATVACPAPNRLPSFPFIVNTLSDRELLTFMSDELGAVPPEALDDADFVETFLPAARAAFMMLEAYEFYPGPPLPCPVVAFAGTQDRVVAPEAVDAWRLLGTGPGKLTLVDGDHFFIRSAQHLILSVLSEYL